MTERCAPFPLNGASNVWSFPERHQLLTLSAAAQRDDLRIVLPDRLRGGAGQKVLAALLGKALIEEIPESEIQRVAFDPDVAEQIAYRISRHGLTAIGIDSEDEDPERPTDADADAADEVVPEQDATKERLSPLPSDGEDDRSPAEKAISDRQSAPRAGAKLANVTELLARPEGASIDELTAATGWLAHTTRAALTGLRKRGISVERDKRSDGTAIYRNALPAAGEVASESEAA